MERIPDDPIVSSIMRTGYPSWWDYEYDYEEEDDDERDRDVDEESKSPKV